MRSPPGRDGGLVRRGEGHPVGPVRREFPVLPSDGTPGLLSLWLAAGQDGQQVYWLEKSQGGITCVPEPRLENNTPPVFSPSGKQVLVLDDSRAIRKYEFPGMRPLASPLESGDDDNPFAESMAYLDERRALIGSGEGRVFVLDTDSMAISSTPRLDKG
jgi:hypothetical protein